MSESTVPKLKVAYFVPPAQPAAGIERVTHDIAGALAQAHPRILDVHVVYSSAYDGAAQETPAYTMHVLGAERPGRLALGLRRLVAAERFDVLVTPQVEASVFAWVATRGLKLPVLLPHLHSNPCVERAEGTLRTRAAFRAFSAVVSRRVPAVLAVSPSLRDYAAASLARHTRVVLAPDPVRDLGRPATEPSVDGTFRFVCVGGLRRQNGQDLLLRALALARPSLPPVRLTLVGQGADEVALRSLCAEFGLDDIVTFAGYSADPLTYLRRSDCFVLASRWDGAGHGLVEALQCGLPVLSTDSYFGPSDMIDNPVIATLVPNGDVEALADGLALTAGRRRSEAEVELRRQVGRRFDRAAAAATHFSILRSVAPVL